MLLSPNDPAFNYEEIVLKSSAAHAIETLRLKGVDKDALIKETVCYYEKLNRQTSDLLTEYIKIYGPLMNDEFGPINLHRPKV